MNVDIDINGIGTGASTVSWGESTGTAESPSFARLIIDTDDVTVGKNVALLGHTHSVSSLTGWSSFSSSIIPITDSEYSLGSEEAPWYNLFVQNIYATNDFYVERSLHTDSIVSSANSNFVLSLLAGDEGAEQEYPALTAVASQSDDDTYTTSLYAGEATADNLIITSAEGALRYHPKTGGSAEYLTENYITFNRHNSSISAAHLENLSGKLRTPLDFYSEGAVCAGGLSSSSGGGGTSTVSWEDIDSNYGRLFIDDEPVSLSKYGHTHSQYALSSALSNYYTKSYIDSNIYKKTETYTQTEVNNLISAIIGFEAVVVTQLPEASANCKGKIYLKEKSTGSGGQDIYDEYVVVTENGTTYTWEHIGNTSIDLTDIENRLDALEGDVDTLESRKYYIGKTEAQSSPSLQDILGIQSISYSDTVLEQINSSLIKWESNNNHAWHFYGNMYSSGYVAAGGMSYGSGGGSGSIYITPAFESGLNLATIEGESNTDYIYVPTATSSQAGVVKVGSGLSITNGVISSSQTTFSNIYLPNWGTIYSNNTARIVLNTTSEPYVELKGSTKVSGTFTAEGNAYYNSNLFTYGLTNTNRLLYLNTSNMIDTATIAFDGQNVYPVNDTSNSNPPLHLGISSNPWGNLYAKWIKATDSFETSAIYAYNNASSFDMYVGDGNSGWDKWFSIANSIIYCGHNLVPDENNSFYLGESGLGWKRLYLYGNNSGNSEGVIYLNTLPFVRATINQNNGLNIFFDNYNNTQYNSSYNSISFRCINSSFYNGTSELLFSINGSGVQSTRNIVPTYNAISGSQTNTPGSSSSPKDLGGLYQNSLSFWRRIYVRRWCPKTTVEEGTIEDGASYVEYDYTSDALTNHGNFVSTGSICAGTFGTNVGTTTDVAGDILPTNDGVFSVGGAEARFSELYVNAIGNESDGRVGDAYIDTLDVNSVTVNTQLSVSGSAEFSDTLTAGKIDGGYLVWSGLSNISSWTTGYNNISITTLGYSTGQDSAFLSDLKMIVRGVKSKIYNATSSSLVDASAPKIMQIAEVDSAVSSSARTTSIYFGRKYKLSVVTDTGYTSLTAISFYNSWD